MDSNGNINDCAKEIFSAPCAEHKGITSSLGRIENKIDNLDKRIEAIDHKLHYDNGSKSIQTQLRDASTYIKQLKIWQDEFDEAQKYKKSEKISFHYFLWPTLIAGIALAVSVIQIWKG